MVLVGSAAGHTSKIQRFFGVPQKPRTKFMTWIKTDDRERAYKNAINLWLKADPENMAVCHRVIEQNKERRAKMSNSYGASTEHFNDLRVGISLPPGLYYVLLKLERFHGREFMKDKRDLHWFARKFPQFCICERI